MNKDLDERLIPNGDYRNAMNIQVSTSEGSDVGTIQNVLGNEHPDIGQDYIPSGSVCIGSIADEKNDCFYWFTTEGSFKTAFEATGSDSAIGLSTTVMGGVNQQGQGNPWSASYWSPPLDGLNGESSLFFDSEEYTVKRTNTIHRLTELHNPDEEYDYKIETVFLDDAGLIVNIWRPGGDSQSETAESLLASGTDSVGNTATCTPSAACNAFSNTVLGGYAMYGFRNNGMGYGSWSGPNPGVNTKFQLNIYDAADVKVGDSVQGIGFNPWSEVSRRYVDSTPEFYSPDVWRGRSEDKKQGSSGVCQPPMWIDSTMNQVLDLYDQMIHDGVAPEQARMILPQSMYTEFVWSGNLYAWASLYNTRSWGDSQAETANVAQQIKAIVEPLFPVSWRELTQ